MTYGLSGAVHIGSLVRVFFFFFCPFEDPRRSRRRKKTLIPTFSRKREKEKGGAQLCPDTIPAATSSSILAVS